MKHIEKTNYLKGICVYRTQSDKKQFHAELSQLQYKKEGKQVRCFNVTEANY